MFQRPLDDDANSLRILERPGQVVEGATPENSDRVVRADAPSHHDGRQLGTLEYDAIQQLETTENFRFEIDQDNSEIDLGQSLFHLTGGRRQPCAMTVQMEHALQRPERERATANQEYSAGRSGVREARRIRRPRSSGDRADLRTPVNLEGMASAGHDACVFGPESETLEPTTGVLYTVLAPLRAAEVPALRKTHVLVVDDEELYRNALERILTRSGHQVHSARNASEALGIVSSENIDLVLSDVQMPGINGLELVRQLREVEPDLPCIVITGYGTAQSSLEALRAGAFWYLEKPFEQANLNVIRRLVETAIEHGRLKSENRALHTQLRSKYKFDNIIGHSGALRRVLEIVDKVADSDSTVLLTGESGTGKELIARALHYNSRRETGPLISINCGAIPEELLESELFGHVKGAFTNAHDNRKGRFAAADGGTMFLDEIGDMSLNLQVKLLRVLQDRSFEPVGSSKTTRVNVRVVAATNQDLRLAIRDRRFREDLYFRLNVLPIEIPPLRERREDIPLLVNHFLDVYNQARPDAVDSISSGAMERLIAYDWPGNIRELENLIERMVLLAATSEICESDLPSEMLEAAPSALPLAPQVPPSGLSMPQVLREIETNMIVQALELSHNNKNQAAKLLDLHRTTLLEKMKKRGL